MSRPSSPRTASPGLLGPGLVVTLPDEVRAYAFYNPADYTKEYISMLLRGGEYHAALLHCSREPLMRCRPRS